MAEKLEMLTSAKVAEKLGVSVKQVKSAIETLNLEPDQKKGVCLYYAPPSVEKIKKAIK